MAAAIVVAILLASWEVYARAGGVDDLILPSPSEVAESLWVDRSLLFDDLVVTGQEVVLGLLLAVAAALLLAVAMHFSPVLRRALEPLLVGSQAIPIVVIAPLLTVWFGYSLFPKLVIVALVCFFPVVVTTLAGLESVDRDQRKLMRTLGASRWQAFRFAEAPAALPAALSGARIAVAIGGIAAVFAEYVGSSEGLGHLLLQSTPQLETARAWAAVVVLAALSVTLFYLLALAERALAPHRKDLIPR
jgi:putative hydroxymethylpyrimidine transport system permease protein